MFFVKLCILFAAMCAVQAARTRTEPNRPSLKPIDQWDRCRLDDEDYDGYTEPDDEETTQPTPKPTKQTQKPTPYTHKPTPPTKTPTPPTKKPTGRKCKLIRNDFIKEEDQQRIVDAHNKVRNSVSKGNYFGQPKPKRPLPNLRWNDGLAELAEQVTETCKFEIVEQTSPDFNCIGQSIWRLETNSKKDTFDLEQPVRAWADKVKNYKYPQTAIDGKPFYEYTQLVWNDTTDVGCAAVLYRVYDDDDDNDDDDDDDDEGNEDVTKDFFFVCNYGPCGNVNHRAPYKI